MLMWYTYNCEGSSSDSSGIGRCGVGVGDGGGPFNCRVLISVIEVVLEGDVV